MSGHARWFAACLSLALTWLPLAGAQEGGQTLDARIWEAAAQLRGIDEIAGEPARVLVFFDANCPHCADLWGRMHPEPGVLAPGVRWIPVAYFNGTSAGRAALMLIAPDTAGELEWNFRFYDRATRNGASRQARGVTADIEEALQRNEALWRQLGALTPLVLFKDRAGTAHVYQGMPDPAALDRMMQAAN